MTTKLQHSINSLTVPPHFTIFPLNYHPSLPTNHLHQQHQSCNFLSFISSAMDTSTLESRNVGSMRKMMLMQEQVFTQQVHEMHRLYNVQKKLMDEIENESKRRRELTVVPESTDSGIAVRHHHQMNDDAKESNPSTVHDEADVDVDLTLSIGHSTTKQKSKSHLHKCSTQFTLPFDSDQSNEGSSSSDRREERVGISVRQDNTRPRWLMQDLRLNRR